MKLCRVDAEKSQEYLKRIILSALVTCIVILFATGHILSQNTYSTSDGYVVVTGYYMDSAFIAESHDLNLDYDPATKNFIGNIRFETFRTGINYIDSLIARNPKEINFCGNIPVEFLDWHHDKYSLNVPIDIEVDNIKTTSDSKTIFTHVELMMNYTCIMESTFDINLSDLSIQVPESFLPELNVKFLHLILRNSR